MLKLDAARSSSSSRRLQAKHERGTKDEGRATSRYKYANALQSLLCSAAAKELLHTTIGRVGDCVMCFGSGRALGCKREVLRPSSREGWHAEKGLYYRGDWQGKNTRVSRAAVRRELERSLRNWLLLYDRGVIRGRFALVRMFCTGLGDVQLVLEIIL